MPTVEETADCKGTGSRRRWSRTGFHDREREERFSRNYTGGSRLPAALSSGQRPPGAALYSSSRLPRRGAPARGCPASPDAQRRTRACAPAGDRTGRVSSPPRLPAGTRSRRGSSTSHGRPPEPGGTAAEAHPACFMENWSSRIDAGETYSGNALPHERAAPAMTRNRSR